MAMGQKAVSAEAGRVPGTVVKWIALYVPLPWPKTIQTRPELDQLVAGKAPGEFAADVAELETLVERFISGARGFDWPAHPIFGRMSDAEWLRWGYLHMDHHLRQFGA